MKYLNPLQSITLSSANGTIINQTKVTEGRFLMAGPVYHQIFVY